MSVTTEDISSLYDSSVGSERELSLEMDAYVERETAEIEQKLQGDEEYQEDIMTCDNDYELDDMFNSLLHNKNTLLDYKKISCLFTPNIFNAISDIFLEYVSNKQKLGSGAFGTAYVVSVQDRKMVVKSMNNKLNMMKEFYIDLSINRVIEIENLPNLVYTFGYFSKQNNLFYYENNLVCEYVSGNVLYKLVSDLEVYSLKEIIACFLQILFTLAITYSYTKFIHNDLTSENIMVSNNPKGRLDYALAGKAYTIFSDRVFVIIDYGVSRVKTEYNDRVSPNCLADVIELVENIELLNDTITDIVYDAINERVGGRIAEISRGIIPIEFKNITYEEILHLVLTHLKDKYTNTYNEVIVEN